MVVVNWGLHYQRMADYEADLNKAFDEFERYGSHHGKAVIFQARLLRDCYVIAT